MGKNVRFDAFTEFFGCHVGRGAVASGQEQDKLLAPPARDAVELADAVLRKVGDFAQGRIAHEVPVLVIDELEVVEVEDNETEGGLVSLGPFDFLVECAVEVLPVSQAGERIGIGLFLENGVHFLEVLCVCPDFLFESAFVAEGIDKGIERGGELPEEADLLLQVSVGNAACLPGQVFEVGLDGFGGHGHIEVSGDGGSEVTLGNAQVVAMGLERLGNESGCREGQLSHVGGEGFGDNGDLGCCLFESSGTGGMQEGCKVLQVGSVGLVHSAGTGVRGWISKRQVRSPVAQQSTSSTWKGMPVYISRMPAIKPSS